MAKKSKLELLELVLICLQSATMHLEEYIKLAAQEESDE